MVLCFQKSDIRTRIACLYGSQTSPVVFACKTATFEAELQVSMGSRLHLSFCACKTAWLPSEILLSMGPSPHLLILDAKQRLLDQNNRSLWVPAFTCGFWLQKSFFWCRIIILYGSHTSPVSFCMKNIISSTRFTSLCGSQTSPVVLFMQNSVISSRIISLYGSQPLSVVMWVQKGEIRTRIACL